MTSISKTVMVIRIILDQKDFTDDFIFHLDRTLPDKTGLVIRQKRHDKFDPTPAPLNVLVRR